LNKGFNVRKYHTFSLKGSNFRINSPHADLIIDEIKNQRKILENYIEYYREFESSLKPVNLVDPAPPIVKAMHYGSKMTGVGPMAAVAGSIAQFAAEKAISMGAEEAIVENGGDIFLKVSHDITVGIYTGSYPISRSLAFLIKPDNTPLAICSSSSKMGHSFSLGDCDLATVVSKSAPIADAAATLACNLVKKSNNINEVLKRIHAIKGVDGVLLVKDKHIGLIGNLPKIVKHDDTHFLDKITRDIDSDYFSCIG
jgi:ApbE superfamily uncharacterized protein (UPF0280 family)